MTAARSASLPDRPQVAALRAAESAVVLLVGDSGTGKTAVLRMSQDRSNTGVVSPAPQVCRFDSGALQNALLTGLAEAISAVVQDRSTWRRLQDQLAHAAMDTVAAIGKDLARAVAKEVLAMAKARLGVDVGSAVTAFWKGLRTSPDEALRRDIKSRTDAGVVNLIVTLAEKTAEVLDRDLVLALDEGNRLSEDDQRILASINVEPPKRVKIIVAWSNATASARAGIELLKEADCMTVRLEGVSREHLIEWLRIERLDISLTDRIYELTNGYPLLVEGLVAHLRAKQPIDKYAPPNVFVNVLNAALLRLTPGANSAARRLSAFVEPLEDDRIAGYLGLTPVAWGTMRAELEDARILSAPHGEQLWFHEMRRDHIWHSVMADAERAEVGQAAFDALLAEHMRRGGGIDSGLAVPIAALAALASRSLATDPKLAAVVGFGSDELAIIAATMELVSDNETFIVTVDSVLSHARSTFGAGEDLLDALIVAVSSEFVMIENRPVGPGDSIVDGQRMEIATINPAVEVVLHGRIQSVLGRPAVPKVAALVARNHLEDVRLESTFMIIGAEQADVLDLIGWANLRRSWLHEPMLGIRLRFGDQPISLAAIFNTREDRAAAEAHARAADGAESAGRRLTVEKIFLDPSVRIPSSRFMKSVWLATGLPVGKDPAKNAWGLRTDKPLSVGEFMRRRVDCLRLVRASATEQERDAMELDLPVGVAVADLGERMYWIELCGTEAAIEIKPDVAACINSSDPYLFSRVSVALGLKAGQRIRNFTEQARSGRPLLEDPVVDTLNYLYQKARRFNAQQPPRRVQFEQTSLCELIAAAHARDSAVARIMSETLTIADRRGHRDQRCLRVAIHAFGDPRRWGAQTTVAAYPVGDPSDVDVRIVVDPNIESAEELFIRAFGSSADRTDFHGGTNHETLASLLGHETDEIQLYTR
jgi:hypothetical protein